MAWGSSVCEEGDDCCTVSPASVVVDNMNKNNTTAREKHSLQHDVARRFAAVSLKSDIGTPDQIIWDQE